MKNTVKWLVILVFIAMNLGFVYWLSTFCNINYFIAAAGFAGVIWCVDFQKRKRNAKILKQQREQQEKYKKKMERMSKNSQNDNKKVQKSNNIQSQSNNQNIMKEHYEYDINNKGRR